MDRTLLGRVERLMPCSASKVHAREERERQRFFRKDYRAPSRIPRTSGTDVKSAKKGMRSVSSASWGSLNHDETGTALFGWKM